MSKQTQAFQAETQELLNLMIHSLYSHREIFLRELISNASDAIEKLKFEGLTNRELTPSAGFEIKLEARQSDRILSISDNGIGMSREEIARNLGTIAHSGTRAFLKLKQQPASPELIGQFGVGFYSAFMVADRVSVLTRKAGTDTAVLWESDGQGTFTLEDAQRPEGPGTTVTLHLKAEEKAEDGEPTEHQDFTNAQVLRALVKKYSDFVAYPIRLAGVTLNSMQALWLKPASEVKKEEYQELYRHLSQDWNEPLKTIHYKAEGTIEFSSILFLPSQPPFDYEFRDRKQGLSLYVRRVFIKSHCEELLPPYLRFVAGMVDSDDLSLNVSREMLQQDRQIVRIRKALTSKVLSTLKELLENDRTSFEKLWSGFGSTLKEGIAFDSDTKAKLQELVLVRTTTSEGWSTLREYVGRMKPGQKAIYFLAGDSLAQLKTSPYLEKLKAKGYEVITLTDRVDGWMANTLGTFEGKPLESIASENLELNTDDEKAQAEAGKKEAEERLRPVLQAMREALGEQVREVKVSERLTESPVCLVSEAGAASAHMERLLQAMGQEIPRRKRVLEVNPGHPLYEKMLGLSREKQLEWADILYQQALLSEGSALPDPTGFSRKVAELMLAAAGR